MGMLAIVNMILLLAGFLVRLRKQRRITTITQKLNLPVKQVTERQNN
jgi:hypothetical protein